MRLKDIRRHDDTTVDVQLGLWAYADLVGRARVRSNEDKRAAHRDRGQKRNYLGDLRGAFCELFLYGEVLEMHDHDEAKAYLQRHIFTPEGGGSAAEPDLQFTPPGVDSPIGIDVKSFDCAPHKRYFAINAEKHSKLAGACDYYMCLLVPPFGKQVAVAELVPYEAVEQWPLKTLGSYGDPSRNLQIETFVQRHFSKPVDTRALSEDVYTKKAVREMAQAPEITERVLRIFPSLEGFI